MTGDETSYSKIEIYTDGACSGNPGPGGWCAMLLYGEHQKALSGHAEHTTNQRMELTAAIEGLRALKHPCEVTVHSDSAYLVRGVNEHQRHKKNLDLWASLQEVLEKHRVTFIKTAERGGDSLFDECHKIARSRTFA